MSSVLKTAIIPYLNFQLKRGVPLPNIDGFGFQNTTILYTPSWIAVCSDVSFSGDYYLKTTLKNLFAIFLGKMPLNYNNEDGHNLG